METWQDGGNWWNGSVGIDEIFKFGGLDAQHHNNICAQELSLIWQFHQQLLKNSPNCQMKNLTGFHYFPVGCTMLCVVSYASNVILSSWKIFT